MRRSPAVGLAEAEGNRAVTPPGSAFDDAEWHEPGDLAAQAGAFGRFQPAPQLGPADGALRLVAAHHPARAVAGGRERAAAFDACRSPRR